MAFIGVDLHTNSFTICRRETDGSESFQTYRLQLVRDQPRINALLCEQRVVLALLDARALVDDDDLIRVHHRRQPMRNEQDGIPAALRLCARPYHLVQGLLYSGLALRVQCGRRLVEQQELWLS